MRDVAGEVAAPHALCVAAEGEGDRLEQPSAPIELPLAALVLRSPQDDLINTSMGIGELSERDGDFTLTLPPAPDEQASQRHLRLLIRLFPFVRLSLPASADVIYLYFYRLHLPWWA